MDILAHALWAGAGAEAWRRRHPLPVRTIVATMTMAALPDVVQMLPLLAWWWFGDGTWAAVRAYAMAIPGQEPALPAQVALLSHHLHCIMHSAVIAGAVTLVLWVAWRRFWVPLLGWWSHIVIDVFTHSARYYASPVLYPFTERGFDGIAWNTPWALALNYAALAAVGWWLFGRRRAAR